jgi:3'(2'), 5'-bisphosphate nucleotidase
MKYEHELEVALQAAALAQRLILEHYARLEAIPNAPANITTDTDRQSQQLILEHLHKAFPDYALCAEETTETLTRAPRNGPRLWMVDPIDGTRGFARKNGEFAVMIAFLDGGHPAVGLVTEPARQRLTYAVRGAGCWHRDAESINPQACRVSPVSRLAQATVTQSHSRNPSQPSRQLQAISPSRVMETYSAGIKLAQVARGEADLYLNTYDSCYDWDICAGQLLVEEAGGRVTNLLGQAPRYGLPNSLQPNGLLASNGLLHEPALAALREVDAEGKG